MSSWSVHTNGTSILSLETCILQNLLQSGPELKTTQVRSGAIRFGFRDPLSTNKIDTKTRFQQKKRDSDQNPETQPRNHEPASHLKHKQLDPGTLPQKPLNGGPKSTVVSTLQTQTPLRIQKMEPPTIPQFPQCSNGFMLGGFHCLDPLGVWEKVTNFWKPAKSLIEVRAGEATDCEAGSASFTRSFEGLYRGVTK